MNLAEEAANEMRAASRRGRSFRILAVVVAAISLDLQLGPAAMLLAVSFGPVLAWALVSGDRVRRGRGLSDGVLARASSGLRVRRGERRWIGVLSVEQDGMHWKPAKRFRQRGATDVALAWEVVGELKAARASPRYISWMVRTDALAVEVRAGGPLVFLVTSPQVIYAALARSGHAVLVPR